MSIVDYIDFVDIGQCAAACVIAMLCPHRGTVYTVQAAHTVSTQAISSPQGMSKAGTVRIADIQTITF